MKLLLQLLALFYTAWIASAIAGQAVPSSEQGVEITATGESQGEIVSPQDQPTFFLHKIPGGDQVLTEHVRLLPDKNYNNQRSQARKPSPFITEFTRQFLHQRALVPLFIRGRALLC